MAQHRIAAYANGYAPIGRLIVFGRGRTNVDGDFEWRLPRASLRRWRSLVARVLRRTGRTLVPAQGWSTDRPIHIQVLAKQIHGILAATPGLSSHGMVFEGQQTAAIDAGNWAWVYANHGGYAAFRADFESEGFVPLPAGRYPVEHHHLIDPNPWDDEPEFGGAPAVIDSRPFEEDDMAQEASVQEAIRIGNVNYGLLQEAIRISNENWTKANAILAATADDATEASVQEAIRIGNVNYTLAREIVAKPSAVIDPAKLGEILGLAFTPEEIATAVDGALAPRFSALPGETVEALAARLAG